MGDLENQRAAAASPLRGGQGRWEPRRASTSQSSLSEPKCSRLAERPGDTSGHANPSSA